MLRPCIDLHQGRVKQIVGATLDDSEAPRTNFESDRPASWYAHLYRRDNLSGGHVVMLGPGNEEAAREALAAYPRGLQIGGGITPATAPQWLEAGASHVIVTSYVFRDGHIDYARLREMIDAVSPRRLVLDLSCRKRQGEYFVVTDRWTRFTDTAINASTLADLAAYCDEFLVHGVDVEGLQQGLDENLAMLLARHSPIPTTYAGGVRSLNDIRRFHHATRGRLGLTIGSALDIFGGPVRYEEAVELARQLWRPSML